MNDEIEQIKEKLNIEDVISSYLNLKKAGTYLKAPCPFHHEKTPSFMVSPERQTFKCFGCGEGGDIFTFVEKIEGVDFYNALKILADRAGIKLQQKSVQYGKREYKSDQKTKIFEINDWTKKLYHKILLDHPKADKARQYLGRRGLSAQTIAEFELGYAPLSWDLLIKFLKNKGYSTDEMYLAGVITKNSNGEFFDRFRGRIMFPINNVMGSTVAFTSRVLEDNPKEAKYINSSESPIYTKGKIIYGLDKAKIAIRENKLAVFVEGNMDVIACHQAGFKNVVATSGTAITPEQMNILGRYGSEIALCFDSDEAGITAMKKAIQIALKNDLSAKVIELPGPFKDPDEAIKSDPKNWQRAVQNAKPALEHWIDILIRKNPELGVLTKKKIAKEILPVIKMIFSDIEKEYYIKYLSKKIAVSEKSLLSTLEKTLDEKNDETKGLDPKQVLKLSLEDKIVGLLWHNPSFISEINNSLDGYNNLALEDFLNMLKTGEILKENLSPQSIIILNQFEMSALENMSVKDEESVKQELRFLLSRLRSEKKEELKSQYAQKIQKAEEKGDTEMLKSLLTEFSNLIK